MNTEKIEILELFDAYETKADKAVEALKYEFTTMKAGRANARILDKIMVNYYGVETPLKQVGNISTPEARVLLISVWDNAVLKEVEKAIIAANIGLTPNNDGKVIRLIFPELTQERRKDLAKQIRATAENTKVALRNARRDINDGLKKLKKDSVISEDEAADTESEVDKTLAKYVETVDKLTKDKEAEVMSV